MPDIKENKNSNTTDIGSSNQSYNDQSGLIIFKHHKNKKSKSKNKLFFERKHLSQSYESGLNDRTLVDYNDITPKYVTSKFAHPISTRDTSFYRPQPEEKLQKLEQEFKVDCVAVTFKRFPRGQNVYDTYDPLKDEHCQRYFQSPLVIDVLKKTIPSNIHQLDSFHEMNKNEDLDPIYKNVKSSGYNLLVPYPYSRTNTIMSRRSTTRTKGSLNDGASNSLISSRESSKNTILSQDYYHRSIAKMSPEIVKFPPIKNGKGSGIKMYNSGKQNKHLKDSQHLKESVQSNSQNKMT